MTSVDVRRLLRWDVGMGALARSYRTPVTTLCLIALAMVFAGTHGLGADSSRSLSERRRAVGSVETLTWVNHLPDRVEVWHDDLYGPFDLWDGEWWRVPAASLHHAGFWHLLFNSLFLAVYGALLERQWGWWRYAAFLIAASLVSMLPEYLLGNAAIGFSGVCCAVYGALWGLRSRRREIARVITNENLAATLCLLVSMVVLTELQLIQIANVAHFTGLGYGWLAGQAAAVPQRRGIALRSGFVLGHALLVVPCWLVVHPFWEGRYHWYLATIAPDDPQQFVANQQHLHRARDWNPQLGAVWLALADEALLQNDTLRAWRQLISGLSHRPTDERLWSPTRRLWRRLAVSPERAEALAAVDEIFGDRSDWWKQELRRVIPPPVLIAPDRPSIAAKPASEVIAEAPRWEPPPAPPWWLERWSDTPEVRSIPADDPRSAREGEPL